MLGFHWSSPERLAQQHAELIVANVQAPRRQITPALGQLVDLRHRFVGRSASMAG